MRRAVVTRRPRSRRRASACDASSLLMPSQLRVPLATEAQLRSVRIWPVSWILESRIFSMQRTVIVKRRQPMEPTSRRNFLRNTGVAVAAAGVATAIPATAANALGEQQPALPERRQHRCARRRARPRRPQGRGRALHRRTRSGCQRQALGVAALPRHALTRVHTQAHTRSREVKSCRRTERRPRSRRTR